MGVKFERSNVVHGDNRIVKFGSGADYALVFVPGTVNADTAIAGVFIGTPNTPAIPAEGAFVISGVVADSDFIIAVNDGGNSRAAFLINANVGNVGILNNAPATKVHIGESADGALLTITGGAGGAVHTRFERTDAGNASIEIRFDGGDAQIIYNEDGAGQAYTHGLDDSDSDAWVLNTGAVIGASNTNVFKVSTAGAMTINADSQAVVFTVNGETNLTGDLNHDGTNFGVLGATPVAQQATIVDADGTLSDITAKFNTLLADMEGFGFLAVA